MAKQKARVSEYRNYYLPYDFPVLLLTGDHWKISNIPSERLHFHNCLEIGICHSEHGYMDFLGQKEPIHFQAGDVTCIPRNIPHTTYSAPGVESRWSYIYTDAKELFRNFPSVVSDQFDLSISAFKSYKHILSRNQYPQIYQLCMEIIKEIDTKKRCYQLSATGLLLALYTELYRVQSEGGCVKTLSDNPPDNAMVLSPVLDYIETHFAEDFDIDYLADICKLSPTHFRRLFHTIIGTNPLDFVNNKRITKACDFLRSTEDSILDISEQVGFHSISSFNRHFMEIMQITPRDFRNETRQSKETFEKFSILEYRGWMYPENLKK